MEKVLKALTPEETTVIQNIQALLNELTQMNSNKAEGMVDGTDIEGVTKAGAPEMTPEEIADAEKKKKEKAEKDMISTPGEGATASDDAKKIIEENSTDVNEESLTELAKAMVVAMKSVGGKKVVKSEINPVVTALSMLTQEVKKMAGRQNDVEVALGQVFDGLGITKQLQIAKSLEPKGTPMTSAIQNPDMIEFINAIRKGLIETKSEAVGTKVQNRSDAVHKNLTSFLTGCEPLVKKSIQNH